MSAEDRSGDTGLVIKQVNKDVRVAEALCALLCRGFREHVIVSLGPIPQSLVMLMDAVSRINWTRCECCWSAGPWGCRGCRLPITIFAETQKTNKGPSAIQCVYVKNGWILCGAGVV